MSEITFECPECKSPLTVDESGAGMMVDCPQCSKKIQIPKKTVLPPAAPAVSTSTQAQKPCPFCGEQILAAAKKCKNCGEMLDQPKQERTAQPAAAKVAAASDAGTKPNLPVFKNEPIMVLILGFITCGLYLIYWNIKMAEVLNAIAGRTVIAPVAAIISGCCAPVNVYYYYLAGSTLADLGKLIGKPEVKDKSTMLLLLGIFMPMVAAMIVQGHVNEVYEKKA